MVLLYGNLVKFIKDNLWMTKLQVKDNIMLKIKLYMKDNLKMVRQMGKEWL